MTDSNRHPSAAIFSEFIARIVRGRAATVLLEIDRLPDAGTVVLPPVWSWRQSRIDVGRKDRRSEGRRWYLPIRYRFEGGPVLVVDAAQARDGQWHLSGLGYDQGGSYRAQAGSRVIERVHAHEEPGSLVSPVLTGRRIERELKRLVSDGELARWECLQWMDPIVKKMLEHAHGHACYEYAQLTGSSGVLLDSIAREELHTTLVFGSGSNPSMADRILERALDPGTFQRVDPIMWVYRTIRRDVAQAFRVRIGDPRIGQKIRSVARSLDPGSTTAEVVEQYRAIYPGDQLSMSRAERALSMLPDPMANRLCGTEPDLSDLGFVAGLDGRAYRKVA